MHFDDSYFEDEVRDGFFVPSLMKRAWASQLEVLSDLDTVCKKLGITYWADAGTMLGAVRHGGIIPWDDDIDVAMPRDDYDRFLEIAPLQLSQQYIIESPRDRDHVIVSATIKSKKGGCTLHNAQKVVHTGAWIDIMMIDGVPDPGLKRAIHWYHYLALRALYQISHFDEAVDQNRERPGYEKLIIRFAKVTKTRFNSRIHFLCLCA